MTGKRSPAQIALRTYALSLSLALGTPVTRLIIGAIVSRSLNFHALKKILKRELSPDGFAFALTLTIGGGAALRRFWENVDARGGNSKLKALSSYVGLTEEQKSFISYLVSSAIGFRLLERGRSELRWKILQRKQAAQPNITSIGDLPPPTLDLTLLVLVRAMDVIVQSFVVQGSSETGTKKPQLSRMRTNIDAMLFWISSARIMWCFFYEPQQLSASYVSWISALANVDSRILTALRLIRSREWLYTRGSPAYGDVLKGYAEELGFKATLGDPSNIPAFGGRSATETWRQHGYKGRNGVGGIPCELVHGGVGRGLGLEHSCTANAGLRGVTGFLEAMAIYLPVHFLPIILSRPNAFFLRPRRILSTLLAAARSASFLSSFISLYWYSVCLTRSLLLARLFPNVSHDFWDGPYGGIMAGSLACGASIWIEQGRRRGEMALYVLPRAIRASLPPHWLRSGSRAVRTVERITFVVSMSVLLTAARHRREYLRGLSRWTFRYIGGHV